MSTDVVLKGAELVVNTVSGHGLPSVLHVAQCRTCAASSELGEDSVRPAAVWAVEHTRESSDHRHYVLTTRRRWRVDPRPTDRPTSPPVPVSTRTPGPLDAGSRTERPAWAWARWTATAIRRVWARIVPMAGPLFLGSVSAALGFTFGAIFAQGTG